MSAMTIRALAVVLVVAVPSVSFAEGPLTDASIAAIARRFSASIKCGAKTCFACITEMHLHRAL